MPENICIVGSLLRAMRLAKRRPSRDTSTGCERAIARVDIIARDLKVSNFFHLPRAWMTHVMPTPRDGWTIERTSGSRRHAKV
ncbi:hypothetical protein [Bosea sp. PAMC 26642]|uniref:hypothetical protein n=1 Tax=Bosea sp. (strain PAMC 26642) TaxID=1792307 RepID=UPI0012E899B7|nr:hypothetical protein [Bosea sp. PAMC 26642]